MQCPALRQCHVAFRIICQKELSDAFMLNLKWKRFCKANFNRLNQKNNTIDICLILLQYKNTNK